jgi:asparagine synthase (glutamine-hydrolysing)
MKQFGFTSILGSEHTNVSNINFQYKKKIENKGLKSYSHLIPQLGEDKLFYEDENYTVVLDGVVLNRLSFMRPGLTWADTVILLYQERGDLFFEEWRGSFGGFIYDKKRCRYLIFSDQTGSKFIYYSFLGNNLMISTMIANLYALREDNGFSNNLCKTGAFMMLTFGYMLGGYTLCQDIKKLEPGYYAVFESGTLKTQRYCLLDNTTDNSITEKDAIEIFDKEFVHAIQLEFDHEKECGVKQHIVSLSAGLDSRMVSWVAHELGYTNQLNITFSQSDYWDEFIPKRIARDLKHEWLYKALDDGKWLYDIDDVLDVTGGNVTYSLQAHVSSLLKYLNTECFGMLHSGNLGDVVFSQFTHNKNISDKYIFGNGAFSQKYLHMLDSSITEDFPNDEIANFYHRGFSGNNNGSMIEMPYVENVSAFTNWDLMNKVLKVPLHIRQNHNLYKKWILKKHIGAANYEWEKMGAKITTPTFRFMGKNRTAKQWLDIVWSRIGSPLRGIDSKNHMNPIGYYLNNDKDLQSFLKSQIEKASIINNKSIREAVEDLFNTGTALEKTQAITLVAAVNKFNLKG